MLLVMLRHCGLHGSACYFVETGKVIVSESHLITTLTAHWINYSALMGDIVITSHQGACRALVLFHNCILSIRQNILMTGDKSNRPPSG